MTAIGLSGDAGEVALCLLTINILLGLLISVRYSPWRSWPHRRINIFWVHNQTGWLALGVAVLHPVLLLFSRRAGFNWVNVVFPAWAPKQPTVDLLGAAGIYCLCLVLITSHYRVQLGRRRWKALHFTTYALAGFVFIHSLLTQPHLNGRPVNLLDGGKLFAEGCLVVVLAAIVLRVRYALRKRRRVEFTGEGVIEGTL